MSEVEDLHQAFTRRTNSVFARSSLTSRAPALAEVADQPPPAADDGLRVQLTQESRANIQRAPSGTRFYCVADTEGTTHCAASRRHGGLDDAHKSSLGGVVLEPIAPGRAGTGHQQVARAAGIAFDEATARVGYVDGEGYGMSIEKVSDCERTYSFRSAFNCTSSPDGSRELPADLAERFERAIEDTFPACRLGQR